ncbi:MAG: hypothetical protein V3U16_02615 [Candidatus Neomarinimicrobiota bacterium]
MHNKPDLYRTRRFTLILSLILISYSIAGVTLNVENGISPIGIPLNISNPNLLGIGLAIACIYGIFQYGYFYIMMSLSPRKARKRVYEGLLPDGTNYSKTDKKYIEEVQKALDEYFPRVYNQKEILFNVVQDPEYSDKGVPESTSHFLAKDFKISCITKVLYYIEDLYFYAPIWLPIVAITMFICTLVN